MTYDDDKYTQALEDLAVQMAAQITEDEYDPEDFEVEGEDSTKRAMSDRTYMVEQELEKVAQ